MFVLTIVFPHDNENLLGVYSTAELADQAGEQVELGDGEWTAIYHVDVDAAPVQRYSGWDAA